MRLSNNKVLIEWYALWSGRDRAFWPDDFQSSLPKRTFRLIFTSLEEVLAHKYRLEEEIERVSGLEGYHRFRIVKFLEQEE